MKRKRGKPVTHPKIKCSNGKIYDTYTEAAKDIGGSRFGVMKCCCMGQSHHHGYKFCFTKK